MESNQIFDPIFEISIKNYPISEIYENFFTSSSRKNLGLYIIRKFANFRPQPLKDYNSRHSEYFLILKTDSDSPKNLVGDDVFCVSNNVFIFF
jgi:hypothetical protein